MNRGFRDWLEQPPRGQRWLAGVLSGLAIEAIVLVLAPFWGWATLIRDGSWSLDGMIRAVASVPDLIPATANRPPNLVFVDVDERTWRSPKWGGGEPLRAP